MCKARSGQLGSVMGLIYLNDYILHDRGSGPEREIILLFVKSLILTVKVAELPT